MVDKYLDKKYRQVVAASEEYLEVLNAPMATVVYGSALWHLDQRDEDVAQYVQAAVEIMFFDASPWVIWIAVAVGLHY